jgi:hypothetical protein
LLNSNDPYSKTFQSPNFFILNEAINNAMNTTSHRDRRSGDQGPCYWIIAGWMMSWSQKPRGFLYDYLQSDFSGDSIFVHRRRSSWLSVHLNLKTNIRTIRRWFQIDHLNASKIASSAHIDHHSRIILQSTSREWSLDSVIQIIALTMMIQRIFLNWSTVGKGIRQGDRFHHHRRETMCRFLWPWMNWKSPLKYYQTTKRYQIGECHYGFQITNKLTGGYRPQIWSSLRPVRNGERHRRSWKWRSLMFQKGFSGIHIDDVDAPIDRTRRGHRY